MKRFIAYRPGVKPGDTEGRFVETAYNPPDEPQFEGVMFSDGKVVQRWLTSSRSVVVWDSWGDLERIHISNHPDYETKVDWLDS